MSKHVIFGFHARFRLLVSFVALIAVLAAGCGGSEGDDAATPAGDGTTTAAPQPGDEVTLRLGWTYLGEFAPFYLGVEKGFFSERGIELEILEGKGTLTSAASVGEGSDDFGFFDSTAAAQQVDKGLPIKGIGQIRQKSSIGIISPVERGIEAPEDIYGKLVSHQPGGSISIIWPGFVAAAGLDKSKFKENFLDYTVYLQALLDGKVDAITGYEAAEGKILESQGHAVNTILFADHGFNVVDYGLWTNTELIESNADLVKRFFEGVVESFEYAQTHLDEAVAAGKEEFPEYEAALAKSQLEYNYTLLGDSVNEGKPIGWIDPAVWEQTLSILEQYAKLKNTDASVYYTNEFLPGG